MPLADHGGLVAGAACSSEASVGWSAGCRRGVAGADRLGQPAGDPLRVAAGVERQPGGRADRGGGVAVGEPDAGRREPVEVGRADVGDAVAGRGRPSRGRRRGSPGRWDAGRRAGPRGPRTPARPGAGADTAAAASPAAPSAPAKPRRDSPGEVSVSWVIFTPVCRVFYTTIPILSPHRRDRPHTPLHHGRVPKYEPFTHDLGRGWTELMDAPDPDQPRRSSCFRPRGRRLRGHRDRPGLVAGQPARRDRAAGRAAPGSPRWPATPTGSSRPSRSASPSAGFFSAAYGASTLAPDLAPVPRARSVLPEGAADDGGADPA